ncbi:MAG TPA: HK97 family phage prohead protease [Candidatus Aquilonibacter sp.]|nr:HK97 family phage prohead protease [Candidatus Aquilonibacter sp.]
MPGTILKPPPPEVRRDFKVHSNAALKAVRKDVGGREVKYLEGIASSTVRDRHGDTITPNAQAMMLEKARRLTMWLNHSYDVPEDILGTCEESELRASTDADGSDILDLVIRCHVDEENPRALKAWKHVEGGTQLGFSIGGAITDCEIDEENDDGTSWCPPLIINGLDLYEISLVGIPANPRSYTRNFVQEMSRGFMRNATRSEEVRKSLRNALPALRATADTTVDPEDEIPAEPSQPNDLLEPIIAPEGQTAAEPTFSATEEIEDDEEPDATASIGAAHLASAEIEAIVVDAPQAASVIETPAEPAVEPSAPAELAEKPVELSAEEVIDLGKVLNALAAAGIVSNDAVNALSTTDVDEQVAAKRAELEQLSSEATQRAAEVQAAEARLAELQAETQTLQQQIEELKATPTGRQTSFPGGSYGRAYQPKTETMVDAQRRLAAKLAGRTATGDDPALRPA